MKTSNYRISLFWYILFIIISKIRRLRFPSIICLYMAFSKSCTHPVFDPIPCFVICSCNHQYTHMEKYTGLTWHPLFNLSLKIPMNVYVFFVSGRQFYTRTSHACLKIRSSKIPFTPPLTFLVFFYLLICVAVKTLIFYGLYHDLMICRMFYLYIGLCGYANSFVSYLIYREYCFCYL
jgi:hypothetical protein